MEIAIIENHIEKNMEHQMGELGLYRGCVRSSLANMWKDHLYVTCFQIEMQSSWLQFRVWR